MHNIKTNFDNITELLKDIPGEINEKGNYLRRGTKPRFSGKIEKMILPLCGVWQKRVMSVLKFDDCIPDDSGMPMKRSSLSLSVVVPLRCPYGTKKLFDYC